jgi:hypothetical protein
MSVAPGAVCCAETNLRPRLRGFLCINPDQLLHLLLPVLWTRLVRGGPSEGGTCTLAESPLRGSGCCLSRRGDERDILPVRSAMTSYRSGPFMSGNGGEDEGCCVPGGRVLLLAQCQLDHGFDGVPPTGTGYFTFGTFPHEGWVGGVTRGVSSV